MKLLTSASTWEIFNKHPRASEIAEGLKIIPSSWQLTPVREKRPYRKEWQHEEPVSREAIATYITQGQELISKKGNPYTAFDSGYGVRLGEISSGLLAIDVDGKSAEPILKGICPELPKSISWSSGKAGRYQVAFQIPPEYREKLALFTRAVVREWEDYKCDDNELLEFRYNYSQSVLPPSYHPDTGRYNWINSPEDTEVAIAPQPILDLLVEQADKEAKATRDAEAKKAERARYLEQRKAERQANPTNLNLSTADSLADILELDILPRLDTEDIYNWNGHSFKRHGKKLVGYCPQHGGSSGTAFQVNPSDNSWYCHGCQEGGHAVQYRHFVNGGHGTPKGKDFVDTVKELADDAGVRLPEWEPQQQKPKTITKEQWWEKFGLTREANNLAKFVRGKFKKFSQVVKPRHTEYKGFLNIETKIIKPITTTTAITLWEPPLKLGRPYIKYTGPGSIPTYSEFQKLLEAENWLIKQPEIKFDLREWGSAPAREAIAKGWTNILDKHGCGEGKSHTYGNLTANKLEGIERTVFAASNHRNPTVASVEQRKDLIAKHSGLTYDYSKKTPLGNPYQVATPSDKKDDIEPPCVDHKLFNTAYALQLNAYSGKGSPICQKCPMFASGCEYLEERRNTLGTEKIKDDAGKVIAEIPNYPDIRADLNGLNQFDVPTTLIVDEIDQTLESSKPLYVDLDDLSRAVMQLEKLKDKKLAVTLEKLIKLLYKAIEDYKPNSLHGLPHGETIKLLPSKSDVEDIINNIYAEDLTNPGVSLWGKTEYVYDVERDLVTGELASKVVSEYETFSIPSIDDIITQCQKLLKTNFDEILDARMTPAEKREALELNHILDFISPILKVINGHEPTIIGFQNEETLGILRTNPDVKNTLTKIYEDNWTNPEIDLWDVDITGELFNNSSFPTPSIEDLIAQLKKKQAVSKQLKKTNGYRKINLSLSKNCLTITKPWYRHQNIINSAKVNIFLDATIDPADLRRKLKLDKDEPILVFSSLEKDHSNLTLKFVQDFGHASNQRRSGSEYCETERITALINQIAENHKDEKIGLIDYKAFAYSHQLPKNIEISGHWGNDSRGSNQFLDCNVMVNIGDFTENLGALAADWQCTTGQITNPTNFSGSFGRYVQRRRLADLEQVIGRLRSTNRTDEQLTIYLPGKWTDEETRAIASRLSGVNIEKVATYDICPKAARKGQQSERKFVEQIWLHIQRGEKFAQEQIAEVVGLTRGRVSQIAKDLSPGGYKQIKKMLVLLWDTLNKTNNPEKALSELPDDAQWFIKEWVPNFHEYVELGETLEDMIENLKVGIDSHGVSLLEYLSVDTILDLIKLFMAPMPISFWESLRSRSGTDVLSPPEPIPI